MIQPKVKSAIVACRLNHPRLGIAGIAREVGCTRQYVSLVIARESLAVPRQPRQASAPMKSTVVSCHQENPTWSTTQIAREVECTDGYVRAIAKDCDLPIPTHYGRPRVVRVQNIQWLLSEAG